VVTQRPLLGGALLLAALLVAAPSAASASTYTVTSTADAGAGTLRQAILDANAHAGSDSVRFNLLGSGVRTIAITTPLPAVTETVIINGRSQPGFAGTPLVRVDNASGSQLNGLRIGAGQSEVLGLEITRFAVAVRLVGDANRVQGNLIGTNAAGDAGLGNATGVRIESGADNRVGGIASNAPNVISASTNFGIEIVAPATATRVAGNRIGTNPAGTAALANGTGLRITGGSTDNIIGGTTTAERNLISGSQQYGIRLMDTGTAQNTVEGNYVGTTADGTGALSNGIGIRLENGPTQTTIGGTTAEARNVISGNAAAGIQMLGTGTANVVAGNYIGTSATGTSKLANGTGIRVASSANTATIGGPTAASRNVISGNTGNGIEFISGANHNTVTSNYIGVDATGSAGLGNRDGVHVEAGPNTIGAPGAGNVISGNSVGVLARGSNGNVVAANYIGTDASGTAHIANGFGVAIGSKNEHRNPPGTNMVGGTTAGARNVISGNSTGVYLDTYVMVAGNYIGTDVTGTAPLGNSTGVVCGSGDQIGITAGARNVISANTSYGVYVENYSNDRGRSNRIAGNYIGTDATGSASLGNGIGVGMVSQTWFGGLTSAVSNNVIGGSTAAARNVISGSTGWGIVFDDSGPRPDFAPNFTNNSILGNYIGTNAAGDAALPNAGGVQFLEGPYFYNNKVGGTGAGQRNVISGNTGWGVLFSASGTYDDGGTIHHDNDVAGNYIGTKSGGGKALANGSGGVRLEAGMQNAGVSANTIAFNGGPGVSVDGTPNQLGSVASRDSILGNSMWNNGALGIDLNNGGNNDQTAPSIHSVTTDGGSTTIGGALDSTASTTFRIELFSSPTCDPSSFGEGRTFLGSVDATTDGAGHAAFSTSVPAVAASQAVTATATNQSTGDTSEFSICFTSPA
jgi:hypothetical protein